MILISILGLGVRVSFVFLSGGDPDILQVTHSGWSALLLWSSVLSPEFGSPYRHLAHGNLGCKPLVVEVLHRGG